MPNFHGEFLFFVLDTPRTLGRRPLPLGAQCPKSAWLSPLPHPLPGRTWTPRVELGKLRV